MVFLTMFPKETFKFLWNITLLLILDLYQVPLLFTRYLASRPSQADLLLIHIVVCETQYWQLSIQAGHRVTKGLYAILQSSQSLSHSHRVVSHMRDIVILYKRLCKETMSAKCPSLTPPNRTPWQSKPLCVTPWLVSGMIATSSVLPPCWNRVNYPQTNPIQSTRFRIHSPV